MHRIHARWPSPAMLVALLALFVAMGGSAYAAFSLPRNSVGTAQLQRGAVTNGKLHRGAVGPAKIRNGAVTNLKLANPSFTIHADSGLAGGGRIALGGSGALSVSRSVIQSRVTGTCAAGTAISAIKQSGGVGCLLTGARDIAAVFPGTTPSFRPEELRGWQSIKHQGVGNYCLIADPSTTTSNAVVLVSLGNEGGGAPAGASVSVTGVCNNQAGHIGFSVQTWAFSSPSPAPSDAVGFTAIIP